MSAPATRYSRDVWGSTVTIFVGAVALQRCFTYGIEGRTQIVGPGMFPAIVSAALLLLGLAWAWQTYRGGVPQPEEEISWPDSSGAQRIGITLAAMTLPAVFFDLLDFRLTVFLMSVVILRFVFHRPWISSSVVGASIALVCYLGLAQGLGMVLPTFSY